MNPELKALLGLAFDLLKLGQDAVAKKNFIFMLPDLLSIVSDIPAAVAGISDLAPELQGLPNAQNQADLSAYIQQKVSDAGASTNSQNILAAALKLIQNNVSDISDLLAAMKAQPMKAEIKEEAPRVAHVPAPEASLAAEPAPAHEAPQA